MISPSLIMLWKFIGTDNGNESYIKKNLSDYYQTGSRNYDPELGRLLILTVTLTSSSTQLSIPSK